jgi:hypothetical protein
MISKTDNKAQRLSRWLKRHKKIDMIFINPYDMPKMFLWNQSDADATIHTFLGVSLIISNTVPLGQYWPVPRDSYTTMLHKFHKNANIIELIVNMSKYLE